MSSTVSLRTSFRRHMREQVLIAAAALTVERGWEQVRMGELAQLVGVSRPLLYKEFGDKRGLGDAMIVREAEGFLDGIRIVLDDNAGDAAAAISGAVSYTLREAERSPLIKAVMTSNRDHAQPTGEETGVLPLLTTSASMLQIASDTLVGWFAEHFPPLDSAEVRDAVDALVRLTVSHLVLPADNATVTGDRISRVALRYLGLRQAILPPPGESRDIQARDVTSLTGGSMM